MKSIMTSDLNTLLCCEGGNRKSFEDFINALTAVRYSLERNEYGEYRIPAVYHMWTGFCIAEATKLNTGDTTMKEDIKPDLDQRLIAILQQLDGLSIGQARAMLVSVDIALKQSGIVHIACLDRLTYDSINASREATVCHQSETVRWRHEETDHQTLHHEKSNG